MSGNLSVGKRGLYLSLAVSLVSLAVILFLTVDEQTIESILTIKPGYLTLAGLMITVLCLVEGLRIRMIAVSLGYRDVLSLYDAVRVFLVTFFFAGVTPLAIGEWPAQIYTLHRCGLSPGESAAVSLVRSFLTKCVSVVMAAFLLFVDTRVGRSSGLLFTLFRYAFWVLTATTAVYLLMMWQAGLAQSVLSHLQRYRRFQALYQRRPRLRRFIDRLCSEAVEFQQSVRQIKRGFSLILPLLFTLLFWGLFYSIAPVLLLGLGVTPDIRAAFTWQVMIVLIMAYVPVPGGSGVAEFGLATLFAPFVPSHILGVFIVAWRFFTYYVPLTLGGLLTLVIKK